MAPRRLVRTAAQFFLLSAAALLIIFFLDKTFRVLPTSIHNRLPLHHVGQVITDIQITTCTKLFSGCNLDSSWDRIHKDLNLQEHWLNHGYVHYKKANQKDLDKDALVVIDVKISRREPDGGSDDKTGGAAAGSTGNGSGKGKSKTKQPKWERRNGGIWIKRGKLIDDAVTAVDVLFGADAVEPRPGWEMKGQLMVGKEASLTVRKGNPDAVKKPELRIRKDGKFKIIQVADIHLSTGTGTCRDPIPLEMTTKCEADPRSIAFLEKMLDEEKPDLAVFTGDQVNGDTAPDAQTAVFKFAEVCIRRKIPFATIYGNHDDEGSLSRKELMELTQRLPYSVSQPGPADVPGVGNFYVEILAHKNDHPAVTLYLLDTHAYSPDEKNFKGYDWIKPGQIEWFKDTHASLEPANKQYTLKHLDMAFIHIPLPEYRSPTNYKKGQWPEGVTAPNKNSGFKDALVNAGVSVVSCGHDHANDYCMLDKTGEALNMWMCYGGGAGFGGYGGYNGYVRRLRFFEIDSQAGRITTWKRLEYKDNGRLDEQIIVEAGKVIEPT